MAREAGVDPALVHHVFGSKESLFAAAVELPVDPAVLIPGLLADGVDGLGERLVRTFLAVWDGTPDRDRCLRCCAAPSQRRRRRRPCASC